MNDRAYLDAFMKTAQYLASLTTHEDVWDHIAELMVKFYGADSAGFARELDNGELEFHHLMAPDRSSCAFLESLEIRESVREVLQTGFLAWRTLTAFEEPYTVVMLPIVLGNETASVMLVGHVTDGPISKDMLNVYLAVAGLVGTTVTKLFSEKTIQTERQRLYDVLETLPVNICLLTPGYQVLFANRAFREYFGESRGRRCYEYIFGQPAPCEFCETFEVLQTKEPHHWERIVPDNRTIDVYDFPFTDTDGSPLILEMDIDITERRQAEAELFATIAKLELLNRELQEFAFIVSHDLQEPLRKIQTFSDMAIMRCTPALDSTSQSYLDRVINSASRMRQLLSDLVQFSRVSIAPELFKGIDLGGIVQEAADVFEVSVKETGCRIEIENMPTIEADEIQILQLFQNLIGNALKFRGDEPLHIRISGKIDGQEICDIRVNDNGIGFDQQFAELIFKPFQRLHGRSAYNGTGMGLAICRKIVERHEGTIRAESQPGKGSTFIIRLPVKQSRSETVFARGRS